MFRRPGCLSSRRILPPLAATRGGIFALSFFACGHYPNPGPPLRFGLCPFLSPHGDRIRLAVHATNSACRDLDDLKTESARRDEAPDTLRSGISSSNRSNAR